MTYLNTLLLIVAAIAVVFTRRANKQLDLRIAELDRQITELEAETFVNLEDVMTKTHPWQQDRRGKSWLKKAVDDFHAEHPQVKAAWDKADGCIIIDDPYEKHPTFDFGPLDASGALQRVIESRRDADTPLMIIQSRVHEEDPLDGELDYSWLTPTHIRGTHPYTYRCGEWAEIKRIVDADFGGTVPRLCFECDFGDGVVDYTPLCDLRNYETK
tara:strand:+ start:69 stop:710 length:642 start_codon:yes stop_codon:yes gene_type:complete